MPFRHAARQISVQRRLAVRRVTKWLTNTPINQAMSLTLSGALFSVLAHGCATGVIIWSPHIAYPDAANDSLVTTRFLYPLMQPQPRPVQERVRYFGLGGPPQPPTVAQAAKTPVPRDGAPTEVMIAEATPEVPGEEPSVFSEIEVDEVAARDPESAGPSYPDSLLDRRIEGETRVSFVVDSSGRAELGSFRVLAATHAGFADAVRVALPLMKFRPAQIGQKKVAQLVEQPFVFKITTPSAIP
jgi:TonB family protein